MRLSEREIYNMYVQLLRLCNGEIQKKKDRLKYRENSIAINLRLHNNRKNNPEKYRKMDSIYYQKNKERFYESAKKWRLANKEKHLEAVRKYSRINRASIALNAKNRRRLFSAEKILKLNENARAWRLKNPEKVKAKRQEWNKKNSKKYYRKNREVILKRGIKFRKEYCLKNPEKVKAIGRFTSFRNAFILHFANKHPVFRFHLCSLKIFSFCLHHNNSYKFCLVFFTP